jgi:hypothetical protein
MDGRKGFDVNFIVSDEKRGLDNDEAHKWALESQRT